MKDSRYQFQGRLVKFGRWLRYRPWSIVKFGWWFASWVLKGAPRFDFGTIPTDFGEVHDIMTRRETIDLIWTCMKSEAQYKMGWYYTSEEVLGKLRDKNPVTLDAPLEE